MNRKQEKLFNIIDRYSNHTILVVGDLILDEYIWGKANRLSPEAPVPVLDVTKYTYIPGGAANVANNITSLGGKAFLAGVVGDDIQSGIMLDTLKNSGINISIIVKDKNRPTTVKTRLLAHNHQQLARADRESRISISTNIENDLINNILKIINTVDLILLSDYAKGVLTPSLIKKVIEVAKTNNIPVLVDPKGLDFTKYKGATLITPNRLEAEVATKSPAGSSPDILAKLVKEQAQVDYVLVTLGEDGILFYSGEDMKAVPAVTSEVYDVTGAGDSLISALALSIPASDKDIETSIVLGNYAAGVAVRKTGTVAVTPDELKNIIEINLMEHLTRSSGKLLQNFM